MPYLGRLAFAKLWECLLNLGQKVPAEIRGEGDHALPQQALALVHTQRQRVADRKSIKLCKDWAVEHVPTSNRMQVPTTVDASASAKRHYTNMHACSDSHCCLSVSQHSGMRVRHKVPALRPCARKAQASSCCLCATQHHGHNDEWNETHRGCALAHTWHDRTHALQP
jgi:hypothetical protein